MKTCPRCRRKCLEENDVMNSISHQDPNVRICSVCGQMEGFVKLGVAVPLSENYLSEEFEAELKKNKTKKSINSKPKKCKKCGWTLLPTDIACPKCMSEAFG